MPATRANTRSQERLAQALACQADFHTYVTQAWRVLEPATPFVDNWHIGLICEYLQAVTDLQINNLIINIPPRHMKTLLVSVFWPTWSWLKTPALRYLTGSYAEKLAIRSTLHSRRLILSPWYRASFGHLFTLTSDQNTKHRYDNDRTGSRLAFGFNAAVTGEGADVLIVDDPLKAQDADSPTMRDRVNEIYDTVLTTRANDPRLIRRVIIMQRLHQRDLTGYLLDKFSDPSGPRYEHLCLPTEYEPHRFFSSLGLKDPRATPGELLWPARFGPRENAAARLELGERAYAGQHAQRPIPASGAIFLAEWWSGRSRLVPSQVKPVARWLSWDTAFKDGQKNDTTAFTVLDLLPDFSILIRHVGWQRLQFPALVQAVIDETRRWDNPRLLRGIIIEDKASGTSLIQSLRATAPYPIAGLVQPFNLANFGSKTDRARQASLWCERGSIHLPQPGPETPWLFQFEELLYNFPAAALDDPIDSFTQGILYLENLLSTGFRARHP